jgi:hypothetical protein
MDFKNQFSLNIDGQSKSGETVSVAITDSQRIAGEVVVPNSTTDMQVLLTLDVSQIKFYWLYSNATVTLETNNAATPIHTVALVGGFPVTWNINDPHTTKFATTDVTTVYITNASGGSATVKWEFGLDSSV